MVLEAGASSFAIDWTLVQRGVSRTVRTYLLQYPDDVAGLVFVDPASEHRLLTMLNGEAVLIAELTAEQLATTFPRSAVRVPRRSPQRGVPFD